MTLCETSGYLRVTPELGSLAAHPSRVRRSIGPTSRFPEAIDECHLAPKPPLGWVLIQALPGLSLRRVERQRVPPEAGHESFPHSRRVYAGGVFVCRCSCHRKAVPDHPPGLRIERHELATTLFCEADNAAFAVYDAGPGSAIRKVLEIAVPTPQFPPIGKRMTDIARAVTPRSSHRPQFGRYGTRGTSTARRRSSRRSRHTSPRCAHRGCRHCLPCRRRRRCCCVSLPCCRPSRGS